MSVMTKYLNIDSIGEQRVKDVFNDMGELGAGTLSAMFVDDDDAPVGGIFLVAGIDSRLYAKALIDLQEKLDREADEEEHRD